jgi:hypothetical protein
MLSKKRMNAIKLFDSLFPGYSGSFDLKHYVKKPECLARKSGPTPRGGNEWPKWLFL